MNIFARFRNTILAATLAVTCGASAAFAQDYDLIPQISPWPVDGKATENTVRLKKYLVDMYGKAIISGQMDLTWKNSVDMAQRVFDDTGKYPAIMGYDFMNYPQKSWDGLQQAEEAIDWWNKGGIVTFCFHWRAPGRVKEFYADKTNFRIPYDASKKELNKNSKEFKNMVKDLDLIAAELKRLQDAGIPVLWRPLHEAAGGWFWWGASGSDAYIALWRYMYDYFVNTKGLHNLLWVWNGQNADWYPGDDVVDIIGYDVYDSTNGSFHQKFNECWEMGDDPENNPKLIALTENGRIPSPAALQEDVVWWSYFMTWNDNDGDSNFWSSETYNKKTFRKEVYNSEYVITLDELPDLKNYPLPQK